MVSRSGFDADELGIDPEDEEYWDLEEDCEEEEDDEDAAIGI